ncbi:phage protein NinX family protein [Pseudomonas cremoricolorata]|uniref:DUF2591 domain-containing protein n=1 Tax=Pseudomonas cremoricolorata TaxID=157783 RepID=A0A089WPG2_9PSED|nr:phage protein NinX family protein [Pseudomonas cremoricolorata]AIR90476.1 hypothetical protein LK03_14785 [Pseudomonas cremoricolorata]
MTDTISVRASNLTGAALDWAVAQAENVETSWRYGRELVKVHDRHGIELIESIRSVYAPSTNWAQGGPLIDKHRGGFQWNANMGGSDTCYWAGPGNTTRWHYGPTALVAFCRSLVESKLGSHVQVPKELMP